MKVLIVSYYFPPGDCIADLRTGKFAKYLLKLGVDVRVLTARGDPRRRALTPLEIPEDLVVRTDIFRSSRKVGSTEDCGKQTETPLVTRMGRAVKRSLRLNNVRMPDDLIGWYPYAVKAGIRLGRQERFDYIFSSSGPVTSHLVAHRLQRELRCGWVADYRDMWSLNHLTTLPMLWHWLDQRLERKTVSTATFLTTVSEPLAGQLHVLHGKKVHVLTNGYDPDDYAVVPSATDSSVSRFVITYTGALYARRDPSLFFAAVSRLVCKRRIMPDRFRIQFYGHDHSFARERAEVFGLHDYVDTYPSVTYYESLSVQQQSTILLLVEEISQAAEGVLTGKVFEYFGAGCPVLAIGHPMSALKGLIEKTGAGRYCCDSDAVEKELDNWWNEFEMTQGVQYQGVREEISNYARSAQAVRLYALMNAAQREMVTGEQICV